jgi:zinc transporter ZupT
MLKLCRTTSLLFLTLLASVLSFSKAGVSSTIAIPSSSHLEVSKVEHRLAQEILLDDDNGHVDDHSPLLEMHSEAYEVRDDKPWGEVILAALLINLASLVGLVVFLGGFATRKLCRRPESKDAKARGWKFTDNMVPSFACGALMATCAFLIVPESIAMLVGYASNEDAHSEDARRFLGEHDEDEEEHADTNVLVAWRFGVSVISGFLLPVLSSFVFPSLTKNVSVAEGVPPVVAAPSKTSKKEIAAGDMEVDNQSKVGTQDEECDFEACKQCNPDDDNIIVELPINYALASTVLIGDFFHNYTDGVLVGTAFSLCHRDLAIAISAATVYHELAQELADFFLLTKNCNLTVPVALCLNFIGGLSVLFGALLILSVDISTNATGCILAFGGGIYIYIAVAEFWPQAQKSQTSTTDKVISLVCFVVGVVPIGLVLLNHGHCDA